MNEIKFFERGSEHEQGWLLQYMPKFKDALQARGPRLEALPKDLELMLELALPLDKKNQPYLPEDMPDWMAPSFFKSTHTKSQVKVGERSTGLPQEVAASDEHAARREGRGPASQVRAHSRLLPWLRADVPAVPGHGGRFCGREGQCRDH